MKFFNFNFKHLFVLIGVLVTCFNTAWGTSVEFFAGTSSGQFSGTTTVTSSSVTLTTNAVGGDASSRQIWKDGKTGQNETAIQLSSGAGNNPTTKYVEITVAPGYKITGLTVRGCGASSDAITYPVYCWAKSFSTATGAVTGTGSLAFPNKNSTTSDAANISMTGIVNGTRTLRFYRQVRYNSTTQTIGNVTDAVLNPDPYASINIAKITVTYEAIPTYSVTYKANGGTGDDVNHTVGYAESIATIGFTDPYRVFVGWNTEPDGSGTPYEVEDVVTSNVTLYAQWEMPKDLYIWNSNSSYGGVDFCVSAAEAAGTVNVDATPKVLSNSTLTTTGLSYMGRPSSDGTVCTLTFTVKEGLYISSICTYGKLDESKGGEYSWNGGENWTSQAKYSSSKKEFSAPDATYPSSFKFRFTGASTSSGGLWWRNALVTYEEVPVEKAYTVTAATSTGTNTYGTVAAAALSLDATETTTITATPATGYQVTNWAVSGTGASISPSGTSNATSTTLTMGTANATVTATFGPKSYTVTLDDQGATTAVSPSTLTTTYKSSTLSSSITNPLKTSYTFGGWCKSEGGADGLIINTSGNLQASTSYTDGSSNWTKDANTTLYAKWTQSITLDREGASTGSTSVTATYNCATLPSITNPTKDGYEFKGWYTGDDGTGTLVINTSGQLQANVSGYTGAGGIWTSSSARTLYAKWEQFSLPATLDKSNVTDYSKDDMSWYGSSDEYFDFGPTDAPNTSRWAEWEVYVTPCQYTISEIGYCAIGHSYNLQLLNGNTQVSTFTAVDTGHWGEGDQSYTQASKWDLTGISAGVYTIRVNNSTEWGQPKLKSLTLDATIYTVTYDANGGSCGKASEKICGGESVTLPEPTRSGYSFDGWYNSSDVKIGDADDSYEPSDDITLYAKWTEELSSARTYDGEEKMYFLRDAWNWWAGDAAVFYAYFWNSSTSDYAWSGKAVYTRRTTDNTKDIWEYTVPEGTWDKVIITRHPSGTTTPTFDNASNKSNDITLEATTNFLTDWTVSGETGHAITWKNITLASKKVYFDNRNYSTWTTAYVRIGHSTSNSVWGAMTKVGGTKYLYEQSTSAWDYHTYLSVANAEGWAGSSNVYQPWENQNWASGDIGYKITKQTTYQNFGVARDVYLCPTSTSMLERECQYYNVNGGTSTNTFDYVNAGTVLPAYEVTSSGTHCTVTMVKYTADDFSTSESLSSGGTVKPTQYIGVTVTPDAGYKFSSVSLSTGKFEQHTAAAAGVTGKYAIMADECEVTAVCVEDTYTITYKDGGDVAFSGVLGDGSPVEHTYGTPTPLVDPTRDGYEFGGWYTNANFTEGPVTTLTADGYTANITLYAQWTKNVYLKMGDGWDESSAWFAIYYFKDAVGSGWAKMTVADACSDPVVYKAPLPMAVYDKLIFVRMDKDKDDLDWDSKWEQTIDLDCPTTNFQFTITDRDGDASSKSIGTWGSYSIPTYTISYNAGTNGSGSKASEAKTCNVDFTLPGVVFSRTGYTQTGWALTENGSQSHALGGNYTTNADQKFYPVWTAKSCSVTFDKESGSGGSDGTTATYGAAMLDITPPTRAGYDFGGYYDAETDDNGSGTKYYNANGTSAKTWDKNTTSTTPLYAKWTAHTYTVNLDHQGGTNATNSVTATYNTTLTSAALFDTPTRDAYTFNGYYTQQGGKGDRLITQTRKWHSSAKTGYLGESRLWVYTGEDPLTLYARWDQNVKLDANGGSADGSVTLVWNRNSRSGDVSVPTYDGHTVDLGYFAEATCENKVLNASGSLQTSVTVSAVPYTDASHKWVKEGATTLYAHWKCNTPTITDNGDNTVSITVPNGTTVRYTTDGTTPSSSTGTVYSAAFDIEEDVIVKAIAYQSGCTDSELASETCTYTEPGDGCWDPANDEDDKLSSGDVTLTTFESNFSGVDGITSVTIETKSASDIGGCSGEDGDKRGYMKVKNVQDEGNKIITIVLSSAKDITIGGINYSSNSGDFYLVKSTDTSTKLAKLTTDADGETATAENCVAGTYYIYAKTATNNKSISFSKLCIEDAVTCTTSPTVTAGSNSSVTSTTATVTCEDGISSLGSAGCSITSYGFVLGTSSNPTTSNTTYEVGTTYTSTGVSFSKNLTDLVAGTTYYVRPYATNGNGTAYGDQTSFTMQYAITTGSHTSGSVTIPSSAASGATVNISASGNTGYNFTSWIIKKSSDGTDVTSSVSLSGTTTASFSMPDYGVTVDATFTAKTYTIDLDDQSATTAVSPSSVTATYNSSTLSSSITNPTKTGYIFDGWYSGEGGTGTLIINSSGVLQSSTTYSDGSGNWANDGAVTLYAKWSRDEKTAKWGLTFNDFPSETSDTREYVTIDTDNERQQDDSKEIFEGNPYYNFGDGEYIDINLASGYYLTDITYSAHYDPWRAKGGTCAEEDGCLDVDTKLYIDFSSSSTFSTSTVLNATPIELTGNEWGDISTKNSVASIPSGAQSARIFADGSYEFGGDLFYLAVERTAWDCTPSTVSFNAGGASGTVPASRLACGETTLPGPGSLNKSGYRFDGWNDGTSTYYAGDTYDVTENVTFTAQWRDPETPLIIPTVTHLDATNYHAATAFVNYNVDGNGSIKCVDISGKASVDWKFKITPGYYTLGIAYGAPSGYSTDITVDIYDVDNLVTPAKPITHEVVTTSSATARCHKFCEIFDLTGLSADKTYKIVVTDTYSNNTSHACIGYIDFTKLTPLTITDDITLDDRNVTLSPGTVGFDVKGDDNEVTCLDIAGNKKAEWLAYITPNYHTIKMLYGTPAYSTNVTFSIINPATGSAVYAPSALVNTQGDEPWYEEKSWSDVDMRAYSTDKPYIIRVADTYGDNTSHPKVAKIDFIPKKYDLAWSANGGDDLTGDYTSGKVATGVAITAPDDPTRTGYDFVKWNSADDGSGNDFNTKMPLGNVTYYAQWTIQTFTITWQNDDGTTLETDEDVEYGETPSYDGSTPTKASTAEYTYTFDTWDPTISTVTEDAIYTATYSQTANNYTLTWDLAGGKVTTAGTGAAVDATGTPYSSVAYGSEITAPVVTKSGYDFAGWSPSVDDNMPAANTTYTATWAEQFTVTYNAMTGSVDPTSATGSTANKVSLPEPTKDGYDFDGWYNTAGEKIGDAGDKYGPTAAITLYAKWKGDCNAGSTTLFSASHTSSTTMSASTGTVSVSSGSSESANNGIKFSGDGGYILATGTSDFAAGDVITVRVYNAGSSAKTIGFKLKSTNHNTSSNVSAGSTGDIEYTLVAGDIENDGTLKVYRSSSNSGDVRIQSVVLTRANACYTVTYHGNNAESGYVDDPIAYEEDDDPRVLSNGFTRTGYEFVGWNTEDDGSGTPYAEGATITDIDDDVTLYAQWRILIEGTNEDFAGYTSVTSADDIRLAEGATLTIKSTRTIHDIILETGSTLNVNTTNGDGTGDGVTLTVHSLSLKGGLNSSCTAYDMPRVYINSKSSLEKSESTVNFDISVDQRNYYPIAVPFPVEVAEVDYVNSTMATYSEYGKHFVIKEYDGASRAENGAIDANWKVVSNTAGTKLQPGKGYILTAISKPAYGGGVIRFPMSFTDAWTTKGEQATVSAVTKNTVAVEAYEGTATEGGKNANKGWNMLGVPYMSCFAPKVDEDYTITHSEGDAFIIGKLNFITGDYSADENIYVTVPTHDFSEYKQFSFADGDTKLLPGWCFFVQVDEGGTLTFDAAGQEESSSLPIYARREEMLMPTVKTGIILSSETASDKTTILVSDKYSVTDYEINADLEKMFGNGYTLATYSLAGTTRLAYNAMSRADATNVIPIGYRAPAEGEYTFAINPRYAESGDFERIDLIDYETGFVTNLLQSSYTFTSDRTQSDSRFALNVVPQKETPTDVEPVTGDGLPVTGARKVIIDNKLYIIFNGKMYDAKGVMVK